MLRDLVAQIHAKTKRPILRIEGHTDAKGSEPYNQDLSVRRAASVKSWPCGPLSYQPRASRPPASAKPSRWRPTRTPDGRDDPEGRQKNRRVEIVVTGRS